MTVDNCGFEQTFDRPPSRVLILQGASVGEALLAVHRSYLHAIRALVDADLAHAFVHVTGGGIPGNTVRVIPDGLRYEVDYGAWERPPVFGLIQERGGVPGEQPEPHQDGAEDEPVAADDEGDGHQEQQSRSEVLGRQNRRRCLRSCTRRTRYDAPRTRSDARRNQRVATSITGTTTTRVITASTGFRARDDAMRSRSIPSRSSGGTIIASIRNWTLCTQAR